MCVRLAVGLGIVILVGMWPCMYADVNECNVCSVCIFLIWDFGFTVSYCEGCENGFARSKACLNLVWHHRTALGLTLRSFELFARAKVISFTSSLSFLASL